MSTLTLEKGGIAQLSAGLPCFYDAQSKCRVLIGRPDTDPQLWKRNLAGAHDSYATHGVLAALEYEEIRDGTSTSLFFVVVDDDGEVVGGVRAQGPYRSAEQAHALHEWTDEGPRSMVRHMIASRIPRGVAEMKMGWVAPGVSRSDAIADVLGRCIVHAMAVLGTDYIFCTGAEHVLPRWRRSGGVPVEEIPSAPYPSARYKTKLVWWERETFADHADPAQAVKLLSEWMDLSECLDLSTARGGLLGVAS